MIAILSDIHGNLEALQAVLDDTGQLNDGETIVFRRVDYAIEKTIEKIRERGDDDMHGMRLRSGR